MFGINIGIDLGTTSIVIYVEGRGIVLSEPSAAAYDTATGRLIAVGKRAYEMFGRTPDSIKVIKPLKNGVVSDFTVTRHILKYFLQKICRNMVFKPNIVVCVPSSVTNLEKRTILELVLSSGAGRACLIEEPLAAALGAVLRSDKPMGTMVVDIG
jgi:rod shape-determining protein MreB